MTALHVASKHGNLEACHYIVTLGQGCKFINGQDDGGWTPLVWGCEHRRFDIVRYVHLSHVVHHSIDRRSFLDVYPSGICCSAKPIPEFGTPNRTWLYTGPPFPGRWTLWPSF